MRLVLSSALVLMLFGCSASHGSVDSAVVPDGGRADTGTTDGGFMDSCVPPPCPAPPEACYYAGGDACSCGELICEGCSGPIVDCAPPGPGCHYVGDSPCECGTIVCDDAGAADASVDCSLVRCRLPPAVEGCDWVPTGVACCDYRLECETCGDRFPDFDNSCTTDADCAIGMHQIDCCGSAAARGINHLELGRFMTVEDACSADEPICDCIPEPTIADDGTSGADFRVSCTTAHICVSSAI